MIQSFDSVWQGSLQPVSTCVLISFKCPIWEWAKHEFSWKFIWYIYSAGSAAPFPHAVLEPDGLRICFLQRIHKGKGMLWLYQFHLSNLTYLQVLQHHFLTLCWSLTVYLIRLFQRLHKGKGRFSLLVHLSRCRPNHSVADGYFGLYKMIQKSKKIDWNAGTCVLSELSEPFQCHTYILLSDEYPCARIAVNFHVFCIINKLAISSISVKPGLEKTLVMKFLPSSSIFKVYY